MPTSLQDPVGQAFQRAQGIVQDYMLGLTRVGVKLRFPDYATTDALGAIGSERLIDRGSGPQLVTQETNASYAARLKAAWLIWYWAGTAYGMLTALKVQGYTPFIIQQNGLRFNLDVSGNLVITVGVPWSFPPPNLWNTFLVVFTSVPSSWTDIQNPPTTSSAPTVYEIQRIAKIINLWRPGHMICAGLEVVSSGFIWGVGTWGSPRTWGGVATTFTVPVGQGT